MPADIVEYTGLALPAKRGVAGYFTPKSGTDLAWSSIMYAILCPRGGRVMNRSFGSTVNRTVFDPQDEFTEAQLVAAVSEVINRSVPLVVLDSVTVVPVNRGYKLTISFSLRRDPAAQATHTVTIPANGGGS